MKRIVLFALALCVVVSGLMWLDGIVKLRLAAVFDAQHGGFATDWSPVSWGSIDELFVNLTMPSEVVLGCEILNRMTALGRPVSYRIGR